MKETMIVDIENLESKPSGAVFRVYETLRQEILDLEIVPDATLSRGELVKRFSVSQTPVREALQMLEQDGLVEIFPQSRTVVTRIDRTLLFETHFLRVAAETEVARRLARMPEADAVAKARSLVDMQATLVGDLDQMELFTNLDRAYHQALFEGIGMGGIHAMLQRRQGALARCQRLELPMAGKMETIIDFHRSILERIAAGDPDGAAGAMRAHLSGSISRVGDLRRQFPDYFSDRSDDDNSDLT